MQYEDQLILQSGGSDCQKAFMDRLLNSELFLYFEYDIAADALYLHRRRGGAQTTQKEERFLASLSEYEDRLVYHDSVLTLKEIFRDAMRGAESESELLFRKDAKADGKFTYYSISCFPKEREGKPTWLYGVLHDVNEKVKAREHARALMSQLDNVLSALYTNIFQMDLNKGLVYHINRFGAGFQLDREPQTLTEYVWERINLRVIAEESVEEYLNWLKPGYIEEKTQHGSYEFEAKLKLYDASEYHWYTETIMPIDDEPGIYIRLRRDINELHEMRSQQYELTEMVHMAEYNRSVLDIMASLAEFRNAENGPHIQHVRGLTGLLLDEIAIRFPKYGLTQSKIGRYVWAATIHDIGKMAIADAILNKPGKLTPEEREIMKTHTVRGEEIVKRLQVKNAEDIAVCCDVVRHHHERYDGAGYPDGLKGDEIAIGVQAVSAADVYDALVSERCYKGGYAHDEAIRMIVSGECGSFSADVLECLEAIAPQIRALYKDDPRLTSHTSYCSHECE